MKIVRRKSDNVVLYLRPERERVKITDRGLRFGRQAAFDITPEDHEVIDGVREPSIPFIGGRLSWDGSWSVVNQADYDAAVNHVPELKTEKERQTVINDPQIKALLAATPEQINNYVDNNVTDLASAKVILSLLSRTVSVLAKEVLKLRETE